MAVTSTDVANQAIQLIGDNQPPVTGIAPTFDTSTAGVSLAKLYTPCVQTVMRQHGWDFSRNTAALTLSGNPAPVPWAFEYLYPPFGIQIRQLMPAVIADANDPLPVNWDVANNVVGGTTKKVIHTNLANAEVVFSNQPDESTWDPGFREAVVRLLSSELAIALSGRPDTAQVMIKTGEQFEQLFTQRDS